MAEITIEEKNQIITWLKRAWEIVAPDVFRNEEGEIDGSIVFSRDEVFEIAADHLEINAHCLADRNLCRRFFLIPQRCKDELKERAFPLSHYSY
jgi:hypothetical protein